MTYECPVLHFDTCDGETERHGQPHSMMNESITGHKLHCPDCDQHLTSLLLCLACNTRYAVFNQNFFTVTPAGHVIHINGDPNMSEKTRNALTALMDAAIEQFSTEVQP